MKINYLPHNKEKLDTYTKKALEKIWIAKNEAEENARQINFHDWLLVNDNMYNVRLFINKLKDSLKKHNHKINNEKEFKNMIASILYNNSS